MSKKKNSGLAGLISGLTQAQRVNLIVALIGAGGLVIAAMCAWFGPSISPVIQGIAQRTPETTESSTPPPAPALEITAPLDGEAVSSQISVSGLLNSTLCSNCNIFIVVHPVRPTDRIHWYGQPEPARVDQNSHFFANVVNVGRNLPDDNCKEFEILAVLTTDDLADARLTETEWEQVQIIEKVIVRVQRAC